MKYEFGIIFNINDILTLPIFYIRALVEKNCTVTYRLTMWLISIYWRISAWKFVKKKQSNVFFFPDVNGHNTTLSLQAEILYYSKRFCVFEFLQLKMCPQMKICDLHLFIPSGDTRYLIHLFKSVCICSSLSYTNV